MDQFLLPDLSNSVVWLVAILFFSYYLIFLRSKIAKTKNYAPQAKGAWPIIGHLPLLRGPKLPHVTLGAMAETYGPIYAIQLGVHPAVVVSSWEIAKEIFTNHDVAVASRPQMTATKHLTYNYAMFGFSPYAPYWRDMRKIVNLELLSSHRLELLKHVRVSEMEISLKELYKLWTDKKDSSNHALVQMNQWFGDLTLNVVFRMVAGKRYFGGGENGDNKEARRCQEVFRKFFHLLGVFVLKDAVPFLGFLDFGGQEKAMKETAKELDSIAGEWLKEHKQKRALGEDKDQDFMDVLLSLLEAETTNPNLSGFDADTINKTTCLSLIGSASDTTKVTLIWALSLLLNNRQSLKKVQEELDVQVGKERLVTDSDLNKLKYFQAVVKETLRLHPPALLLPRLCTQDITLNGYHVSAGTWVFLNLWKIQTDPRVWSDPYEFKPERFFAASHKDVDVRGQHFEMIPFGCGRRLCPGITLGLQMLHLTLASLLHAFHISTPSNARVDMTETVGLTNIKASPLEVLITPRLSPKIYG
ncbi:hypothetical protein REPUB_Repub02eG0040800 [Reevesia pubescens]